MTSEHLTEMPGALRFNFLIPDHLIASSHDAITRLRYLLPEITFDLDDANLMCSGPEEVDWGVVRQEVYYALCRSKIRLDGVPHRNALFAAIFDR